MDLPDDIIEAIRKLLQETLEAQWHADKDNEGKSYPKIVTLKKFPAHSTEVLSYIESNESRARKLANCFQIDFVAATENSFTAPLAAQGAHVYNLQPAKHDDKSERPNERVIITEENLAKFMKESGKQEVYECLFPMQADDIRIATADDNSAHFALHFVTETAACNAGKNLFSHPYLPDVIHGKPADYPITILPAPDNKPGYNLYFPVIGGLREEHYLSVLSKASGLDGDRLKHMPIAKELEHLLQSQKIDKLAEALNKAVSQQSEKKGGPTPQNIALYPISKMKMIEDGNGNTLPRDDYMQLVISYQTMISHKSIFAPYFTKHGIATTSINDRITDGANPLVCYEVAFLSPEQLEQCMQKLGAGEAYRKFAHKQYKQEARFVQQYASPDNPHLEISYSSSEMAEIARDHLPDAIKDVSTIVTRPNDDNAYLVFPVEVATGTRCVDYYGDIILKKHLRLKDDMLEPIRWKLGLYDHSTQPELDEHEVEKKKPQHFTPGEYPYYHVTDAQSDTFENLGKLGIQNIPDAKKTIPLRNQKSSVA